MPDMLAIAIYDARANGQPGFKKWADLAPFAQDHWRNVAETARTVVLTEVATPPSMPAGVADVIAERLRQKSEEGWTTEHDDEHLGGEMALAAAVYAAPLPILLATPLGPRERHNDPWPWWDQVDVSGGRGDCPSWGWVKAWFKPTDRRRDLVKATALLIAEIERLDRAALSDGVAHG